jgi:hypothetical protein
MLQEERNGYGYSDKIMLTMLVALVAVFVIFILWLRFCKGPGRPIRRRRRPFRIRVEAVVTNMIGGVTNLGTQAVLFSIRTLGQLLLLGSPIAQARAYVRNLAHSTFRGIGAFVAFVLHLPVLTLSFLVGCVQTYVLMLASCPAAVWRRCCGARKRGGGSDGGGGGGGVNRNDGDAMGALEEARREFEAERRRFERERREFQQSLARHGRENQAPSYGDDDNSGDDAPPGYYD